MHDMQQRSLITGSSITPREHFLQKMRPHTRQWCLRLTVEKRSWQLEHSFVCSSGTHN
jgi:hypothetical protein